MVQKIIRSIKSYIGSKTFYANSRTHVRKVLEKMAAISSELRSKDDTNESASNKLKREIDISENVTKRRKGDPFEGAAAEGDKRSGLPYRKKKMAMLMVYSGKGYLGMQRNPGSKTIEEDLLQALVKAGVVTEDHISQPGAKMAFQRAARTDKGVSAAGQLCSLKMFIDVEDPVEKINKNLVDQIRVLGLKKTTKGFNSKNWCMARTYIYMVPTFAFAPMDEKVQEDFRISEELVTKVRRLLKFYEGTHNFHNFTSGKKPDEMSAKRYIMRFGCGDPFVREGIEFMVLEVKGQSFMIHQIRKMIGMVIAVMRGFVPENIIEKAFQIEKMDIPKAPGLGLILDKCHYDQYNKLYAKDGSHAAIDWEEFKEDIDGFKEKFIFNTIIETEKSEKSMLEWLSVLPVHTYERDDEGTKQPLLSAHINVQQAKKESTVSPPPSSALHDQDHIENEEQSETKSASSNQKDTEGESEELGQLKEDQSS